MAIFTPTPACTIPSVSEGTMAVLLTTVEMAPYPSEMKGRTGPVGTR